MLTDPGLLFRLATFTNIVSSNARKWLLINEHMDTRHRHDLTEDLAKLS